MVAHAREAGIDVIVTDHHLPEAELPAAVAIINPNRPDCGYPEKNLCGAGVTFKLVQALLTSLGWPAERVRSSCESFLKMVAIATVADVVPLTGENRVIVKRGLERLSDGSQSRAARAASCRRLSGWRLPERGPDALFASLPESMQPAGWRMPPMWWRCF